MSIFSKNGFLLLSFEAKGLDRPIVANFGSDRTEFLVVIDGWRKGLVEEGLLVAMSALATVLLVLALAWFLFATVSVNRVSLCTPEMPFWVKWVTLMGILVGVISEGGEVGERELSRS